MAVGNELRRDGGSSSFLEAVNHIYPDHDESWRQTFANDLQEESERFASSPIEHQLEILSLPLNDDNAICAWAVDAIREREILAELSEADVAIGPDIDDLPVFEPGANEIIDVRRDGGFASEQTMIVLGRSADGDRVFGREGGAVLSVSREAFAEAPRVDDRVTIRHVDGHDRAELAARDVALEL